MDSTLEREIHGIASDQYGLVTRSQAMTVGVAPGVIDRLTRKGTWARVAPAVYRMPGASPSWWQEVMLATLSVDDRAAASHQTAAILWQLIDVASYPIQCRRGGPDGGRGSSWFTDRPIWRILT